jgi:hypothetical protein
MTTTVFLSDNLPHYDRSASDHPEFYYSPKTGRYHYRDTGKFVSQSAREALTRGHINQTRENLRGAADRINEVSFKRWQKETFTSIKIAHTQSYLLERGGIHQMEKSDYATLTREMRFQRDRFKRFSQQILDGTLSDAAIRNRLTAYGEAVKVSGENGALAAAVARGMTEERNILGKAEHCPDCVKYTNMGWQPIGTLPRPTKDRQCMYNCQCRMEVRAAQRTDDGEPPRRGLVKKVITNVQREQQTVWVRPEEVKAAKEKRSKEPDSTNERSKLARKSLELALKTYETEELPGREELIDYGKAAIADFMKDPVGATRAGIARESQIRKLYKERTGESLPSHGKIIFKSIKDAAVKFIKSPEAPVTAAGIAGGAIGGAVAGPAGALAGDLLGSLAVRKASEGIKAYRAASQKLNASSDAYEAGKRLSGLKTKANATLAELKEPEMQQDMEKELIGDVAGWAIGNATGAAINSVVQTAIPFGAGAAIATVPTLVVPVSRKAHRYVRAGMKPSEATQKAFSEYFAGDKREADLRKRVSAYIRTSKHGVSNVITSGVVSHVL